LVKFVFKCLNLKPFILKSLTNLAFGASNCKAFYDLAYRFYKPNLARPRYRLKTYLLFYPNFISSQHFACRANFKIRLFDMPNLLFAKISRQN